MAGVFGSKYISTLVMERFPRLAKAYEPVALVSTYYIMMIIIFINTIQRERGREGAKDGHDRMSTHRLHVQTIDTTTSQRYDIKETP